MKTSLLFWLLIMSGVNLFLPGQLFFGLMVIVLLLVISFDKSAIYSSSYYLLTPFLLLVSIGFLRGVGHPDIDLYRDVFIFAKNIIYFIVGIALSRYIRNFTAFFKSFLILAFASSLFHIGTILTHLKSISSLESIRSVAGYANAVEGISLSLFLANLFSKKFRSVIQVVTFKDKVMIIIIATSFLLYFSRTLIVLITVVSFFLSNILYIRKIFARKNVRVFNALIVVVILFFLISYVSSLMPPNSLVRTLVSKFENIPEEVTWNAQKNGVATKEEIQDNWRGYEAYQGLLKFNKGNDLQRGLGFGFGERVNLGIIMKLGEEEYEAVPILHNEYVTLLVKSGIIGVLLYLFFLYQIGCGNISYYNQENPEIYYSYQMLSALSLVSLLNTFIGFGLLDPTNAAIPIFFGFFWGNIQRHKNQIQVIDRG